MTRREIERAFTSVLKARRDTLEFFVSITPTEDRELGDILGELEQRELDDAQQPSDADPLPASAWD